jgi:hypothetical protein
VTEPTGTPNPDVVHLVLPVGDNVPMAQLVRAQSAFLDLLREVSRAVAATFDDPVTWVVTNVQESSADYSLVPIPLRPNVPPQQLHLMVEVVPDGIARLEKGEDRPPYFTDHALELTTTLTKIIAKELPFVRTRNGAAEVDITAQAGLHARRILDRPYVSEMGTVEGKAQIVNTHGKRQVVIFDELTGQRIECQFGQRIALADVLAGMERRVAITGEIRSRESGEILSVIATDIEVLPTDDELPTANDVLGVLSS